MERAKSRSPEIEQNIDQLYFENTRTTSIAASMIDQDNFKELAKE